MDNELFRHGALLSFLFAGAGVGFILKRYGFEHAFSISTHAAKQRFSYWVFFASLIAAAGSFYLFTQYFLTPYFGLGDQFSLLVAVTLGLILATAIVPDTGGRVGLLHGVAAWSMAVCLPIILASLLLSGKVNFGTSLIVGLAILYMVIDWFLFLFVPRTRQYFLLFQGTYVLSFFIAMIAVAYLG